LTNILQSGAILVILMTMSETLSLAQAKAHLSELVGRVDRQHERVTVTVHGRPSAVLLSPDDLEALEETIAILSDAEAVRQLTASDAELARGEGESEQDLAVAMGPRGKPV
jgi:antitoxin YefM